jgi:hypothetical protein
MGDEGALKMSENPKFTKLYREARAPEWEPAAAKGILVSPDKTEGEGALVGFKPWEKPRKRLKMPEKVPVSGPGGAVAAKVDVRETAQLSAWDMPITADKAIHQYHLENFFDAIRKGTALNCPGESAFATAVTVLKVNQAIAAQKMLTFDPKDFVA